MTTSAEVNTEDLRAALRAVLPHVPRANDSSDWLQVVRVSPFGDGLEVTATDRYTAALATVPVWEYDGDGADVFDLTVDQVRAFLEVFPKPGKGEEHTVRLDVLGGVVRLVDTSGLFDGKELTLPIHAVDERFPEIRNALRGAIHQEEAIVGEFWLDERRLTRFAVAQRVYGYPLVFEPARAGLVPTSLVVRCGPSFVGRVALSRPDEEAVREADAWARTWIDRLGPIPAGAADVLEAVTYAGPRPAENEGEEGETDV